MNPEKTNQNSFPEPYELIAIDSDSDSSDSASVLDAAGDDDSNSNGNFNALNQDQAGKENSNDKNIDELARQELKKLSLDAHGTFMADFDPEKSKRELRKMNRRLNTKGSKRFRVYDEKGLLLECQLDICDCLDKDCPGCFFPCPKCSSGKCGSVCRCNRRYTIDYIEVEGTSKVISSHEGWK